MKQFSLLACLVLFSAAPAPKRTPKIKMPDGFVYIPSGAFTQKDQPVSIQGFYMLSTEVTNLEYREFLNDLQTQRRTEAYMAAKIQPTGWEGWHSTDESKTPFAQEYGQHPAYENYPVVNITREAAQSYCKWLTENLQAKNPDFMITARLPLEVEWVYAASAGKEGVPYSNGYYLHNAEGKMLYTYRRVGDENIHTEKGNMKVEYHQNSMPFVDPAVFPSPAKSNSPNAFGLYNTCGNVAEMIAEPGRTKGGCFNSTGYDIRIDAPDEFAGLNGASPFIGFRVVASAVPK